MANIKLPTPAEIKAQLISDLSLGCIESGITNPPVQQGGEWDILATGESQLAALELESIQYASLAANPKTATGVDMDDWLEAIGLSELPPVGASGKIILQGSLIGLMPSGETGTIGQYRYAVSGGYINVPDKTPIDIVSLDTGVATNQPADAIFTWDNPPSGVRSTAPVSAQYPIKGGRDAETIEQKRQRFKESVRYSPGGGNWAHLRKIAMDTSVSVSGAYVYPALGGPASMKTVVTVYPDPNINSWSRVPTPGLLASIRANIQALAPDGVENVVQAPAEEAATVSLSVEIQPSVSQGGDGTGWLDADPWPQVAAGVVYISNAISSSIIRVSTLAVTNVPVANRTHIAWWCPSDQKFYVRLITAVSTAGSEYQLTLDKPLLSSKGVVAVAGQVICPACANIEAYGNTWRDIFSKLGPSENTSDPNRLPRALRHPKVSQEDNPAISGTHKRIFLNAHPEVMDVSYWYLLPSGGTPTIPATVAAAPNMLRLDFLGVYPPP